MALFARLHVAQYAPVSDNRLTSAFTTVPGLPQEFYSYDPVGNRVTSYLSNTHTHDAANQLLEDQQFTYTYDPNGNQTSKTAKNGSERWLYTYDAENQLVGAQRFAPAWDIAPTMTASYSYDGMGRRIAKTVNGVTTTYVYDNEDILSFNGSKVTHGPGIDEPLKVADAALLQDALGSVIAEVSSSGASQLNYESFGSTKQAPSTPFGFTSREADVETGLDFYRARYYESTAGRFLSKDPDDAAAILLEVDPRIKVVKARFGISIAQILSDGLLFSPQSLNAYPYGLSSPTNLVDPFGKAMDMECYLDCRTECKPCPPEPDPPPSPAMCPLLPTATKYDPCFTKCDENCKNECRYRRT